MSSVSKRRKEGSRTKIKSMGDHKEFLKRITKTLYYGQLPTLPCLSLPVTEISCEAWSVSQRGRSLRRLHADAAAGIARGACVSPCALVLALLYLERLHTANPDYLANTPPADLFLVSLMVGNKFLQDDGEDDEVICSEWAASGGIDLKQLKKLEVEFLSAIDWNIFVSEKSFEDRLQWLERRVALKQARERGYFTYGDLAAATAPEAALLRAVARGLSVGWLAALAAYAASLAALLALVASTLLLTRAAGTLRSPGAASPVHPATYAPPDSRPDTFLPMPNDTARLPDPAALDSVTFDPVVLDSADATEKLRCCTRWLRHLDATEPVKQAWPVSAVAYDWRSLEPWWSTTSVLNWLYQSSLIGPMQRWLERVDEAAGLRRDPAGGAGQPRCVRQWLDLNRLGAMAASVSDR